MMKVRKMKTDRIMNYKSYLVVSLVILCGLTASGQEITDSKTYMKSFRVGENPTVDVSNKYGNIHISHVKGDSVNVRVEVTATSTNASRLQGMMSDVEISLTMTNQTVRAQTIFAKSFTALLETFKGLTKSIINYESRLRIDYFIKCPPSTALRLTNSYGDVYIGENSRELTLTLSNGSLDAEEISNALSLDLTFCKADIGKLEEGRVSVSFGELRMNEADNITLITRSSKVHIEDAGELNLDSKRDVLNIGTAATITGTTYFTELSAKEITGEISLLTKYGNLTFDDISENFSLVNINSSYADVDLSMAPQASYNMEIRHTDAFVTLPGVSPEPEKSEISAENKIFLTTGKVGPRPSRARIRIEALKGEIRLKQK